MAPSVYGLSLLTAQELPVFARGRHPRLSRSACAAPEILALHARLWCGPRGLHLASARASYLRSPITRYLADAVEIPWLANRDDDFTSGWWRRGGLQRRSDLPSTSRGERSMVFWKR